jgi:hypothetical protein
MPHAFNLKIRYVEVLDVMTLRQGEAIKSSKELSLQQGFMHAGRTTDHGQSVMGCYIGVSKGIASSTSI